MQTTTALVRDLSPAFADSLKMEQPESPIDVTLAAEQHAAYVKLLSTLADHVVPVPASSEYPDCNFIEDTAIVVGDVAVMCRPGAESRRGETTEVRLALERIVAEKRLKEVLEVTEPATMDGGDVLFTGRHLFIGLSRRTNAAAVAQVRQLLDGSLGEGKVPVHSIEVAGGLHLKSAISHVDDTTILVADCVAGKEAEKYIAGLDAGYRFHTLRHPVMANVLRVGDNLLIQAHVCREGEKQLEALAEKAGLRVHMLDMSELIKADGALTCGSILISSMQQ